MDEYLLDLDLETLISLELDSPIGGGVVHKNHR